MATSEYLLARRNDLSGYLVHLTRQYGRQSAADNLVRILKERTIRARGSHCLFMHDLTEEEKSDFSTVCFTETPLSDLNYVTQEMRGRKIRLSQYGLVFAKGVVLQAGGNPVFYVDARSNKGRTRCDAFRQCFRIARKRGMAGDLYTSFLPLVNKVDTRNDFTWEREWRVVGDFAFELSDVFLGLAPKGDLFRFENDYPLFPWVSPRWGRDQMMAKLRRLMDG